MNVLFVSDSAEGLAALESSCVGLDVIILTSSTDEPNLRKRLATEFSIAILDAQDRAETAYQAAQIIRSSPNLKDVPLIFLCSHGDTSFPLEQAYELGAVDHLVAPFMPAMLKTKVRIYLQYQKNIGALRAKEKIELSLRENQERLKSIISGAATGVVEADEQGRMTLVNQKWCEMIGYSEAELLGRSIIEITEPESVPETMEAVQKLASGESQVVIHKRYRRKDGTTLWATSSVGALHTPDGRYRGLVAVVVDTTAQRRLMQSLSQSHELLSNLSQQVPGVLYQFLRDADGRFTLPYVSDGAEMVTGLTPSVVKENIDLFFERIHDGDREAFMESIEQSATRLEPWHFEFRMQLPDQGLCWREGNAKPIRLEDGSVLWHGFITDISERKRIEQEIQTANDALEQRANYDGLTRLPNRSLFRDRLDQQVQHAKSTGQSIALLFLDLDGFKGVNDLLGHEAGDRLLQQAAKRIQHCVRPADTVARLGGDEFTVILADASEREHIEQVAQRIVDALARPFHINHDQVQVSGSIGITIYPMDAQLPDDLIRNADQAMYFSKAAGRNQVSFFERSMQTVAMKRLKLITDLRKAISERQMQLHFQPIVEISTGRIVKAEALLRWSHPDKGMLLPLEFIGLAEETGLINEIGDWVFAEAAFYCKRWSSSLGHPFQVSINKSPVQFRPQTGAMNWTEHLARLGLERKSISIEITEGVLLNVSDDIVDKLMELHSGGIEVAIDDFGIGYSSLSYLKKLKIDYLKIDQSFVRDMLVDASTKTIVETIIVMAHKLGLEVIAEGVESTEQCKWLQRQGCDYAQGFLFSEALPPHEFERLILSQPPRLKLRKDRHH